MQKMIGTAFSVTTALVVLVSCAQSPGSQEPGSPAATPTTAPTSTSVPPPEAKPAPGHSFAVTRELDARAIAEPVDPKTWDRDLVLDTTRNTTLPKDAVVHDLTDTGGLLISHAKQVVKDGIPILQPAKVSLWSPDGRQRLLDDATGAGGIGFAARRRAATRSPCCAGSGCCIVRFVLLATGPDAASAVSDLCERSRRQRQMDADHAVGSTARRAPAAAVTGWV